MFLHYMSYTKPVPGVPVVGGGAPGEGLLTADGGIIGAAGHRIE